VQLSLFVLAAAAIVRSYLGAPGLWIGTLLVGAATAVGNVLMPVFIRRDHLRSVSRATGIYSSVLTAFAGVGSALSVPLAAVLGWRGALAAWSVYIVVIAVLWTVRARVAPDAPGRRAARAATEATAAAGEAAASATAAAPAAAPPPAGPSVWRRPDAWLLTVYMGLQSSVFYILVNWLPTIESWFGMRLELSGLHLLVYQLMSVPGSMLVPLLLRRSDLKAAVAAAIPFFVGMVGLVAAPQLVFLWVIVAGLTAGSSLVVPLTLVSKRGRDHREIAQLSGMVQSGGYFMAGVGPFVAGLLAQATGGWTAGLVLLLCMGAALIGVAFLVGRVPARLRENAVAAKPQ